MITRLIILILTITYIYGQDSLYWFDMNSVRDPIPKTSKVLDKIFGASQIGILDSLKKVRISTRDGFRLQVYESSSVDAANHNLKKFKKALDDSVYMIFEAPLYKIRTGNFITKKEAETRKKVLKNKGYRDIWIVRSRIEHLISE